MKTVFIYALCEPKTRTIRDIGKAKDPEKRLKQHWYQSRKQKNHLGYWLSSLTEPPSLLILKEVPESEWQEWEQRYIRCARALGFALVNGTDGGEGVIGRKYVPTEETKKKQSSSLSGEKNPMFGRKHSDSARQLQRKARLGKGQFGEKNGMFGKKHSFDTRQRMIQSAVRGEQHKWFGKGSPGEKNGMFGIRRFGDKNPMFGKKLSAESILKRQASRCFNNVLKICQPLE